MQVWSLQNIAVSNIILELSLKPLLLQGNLYNSFQSFLPLINS